MAETFEARRQIGGTQQRVCLKRVLPAFSEDPKFNQQFLAEARIAASLRHSNIVSVLDFGAIDGTEFMVLELVDGLDLRALLASMDSRRLDAELVALIGLDLAYALSYAHSTHEAGLEGVVHRDISPANVLISVRGEVKLADFGIAKAMTNALATASGVMQGKIPYMSPEQMRTEEVDGRSDLFSLGVSLYEALAGERPFQGSHEVEVMTRLLAGERRPLRELAPEAPTALVDAIEGLLQIRAAERTATAEHFVDALANCAPTPVARRRLADLVQQRGGLKAPRPGRELTYAGNLDTELGQEPVPLNVRAHAPAVKAVPKATVPATPGLIQAAEIARAAAAAMASPRTTGSGVSKSTIPSSPRALSSAPPAMPVPKGTIPSSPRALSSAPPAMPVPKDTIPSSPSAIAAAGHESPAAPADEAPVTDPTLPPRARGDVGGRVLPSSAAMTSSGTDVRFPAEPSSDEVVLPLARPRLAPAAAALGVLLLVGSAGALGLSMYSGDSEPLDDASASTAGGTAALTSPSLSTSRGDAGPEVVSAGEGAGSAPGTTTEAAGATRAQPATRRDPAPPTPNTDVTGDAEARGSGPESAISADAGAVASTMDASTQPATPRMGSDGSQSLAAVVAELTMRPREAPAEGDEGAGARASEGSAAPGSVRVTIRTDPWGSVWVDNRYIGRSPAIVLLPVGPHELGGGVGHVMGTHRVRVTSRSNQHFVVHVDYPEQPRR